MFKMAQKIASEVSEEEVEAAKILKEEDTKPTINLSALDQAKNQFEKLLKDFEEFYGPKGRSLKIVVHIIKDDKKDTVAEKWMFGKRYQVISAIDIGTALTEEELDLEW